MKEIQLTQGQVALVDDADYEWLNQWKWFVCWNHHVRSFYAVRNIRLPSGQRTTLKMHRLLLGLERGDPRQCDHINHQTLDNQRGNLRIVTNQENHFNAHAKGYYWNKKMQKYKVQIGLNGDQKYLGYFDDPAEAHQIYLDAKTKLHQIRMR